MTTYTYVTRSGARYDLTPEKNNPEKFVLLTPSLDGHEFYAKGTEVIRCSWPHDSCDVLAEFGTLDEDGGFECYAHDHHTMERIDQDEIRLRDLRYQQTSFHYETESFTAPDGCEAWGEIFRGAYEKWLVTLGVDIG